MSYIFEEVEPFCSVLGVGSVCAEGHLYTNIGYMIECWQKAEGTSSISGLIDADWKTAARIRRARGIVLILETGEEVAVAVVGNEAGFLEIEVHDPIEGCRVQGDLKQMEDVRRSQNGVCGATGKSRL